jgi:hypothetical protein
MSASATQRRTRPPTNRRKLGLSHSGRALYTTTYTIGEFSTRREVRLVRGKVDRLAKHLGVKLRTSRLTGVLPKRVRNIFIPKLSAASDRR